MTVIFICDPTKLNHTAPATDAYYTKMLLLASKQSTYPTALIVKVSPAGMMHINFNKLMKVPDHPTAIGNTTVLINGTEWPMVELTVVPGVYSDMNLLKFNWTFVDF
jgi:hypothetical protein